MKKVLVSVIGLAVIVTALMLAGCAADGTIAGVPENIRVNLSSQQEGIWVTGQGKVAAAPDVASLRLGIEAQNTSVASAQTQAQTAMDNVMKALRDGGVAEKDIQTSQFSIHKVTRWDNNTGKEVLIGYRVTNIVTAKIRNIETTGAVVDAVTVAGGDLVRIDSIGFSVDDPTEFQEEARALAVAEAKEKAGQMAGLAGVKLGKPTYMTESFYVPSPVYRGDMLEAVAAPAAETPISPGELEISITVNMAFGIQE